MDAIRYLIDTMVAVSFTIEKVLWVIERYLQINLNIHHFTKEERQKMTSQLQSGGYPSLFQATCCLFSGIPIPLSKQPLATARIKRETEA